VHPCSHLRMKGVAAEETLSASVAHGNSFQHTFEVCEPFCWVWVARGLRVFDCFQNDARAIPHEEVIPRCIIQVEGMELRPPLLCQWFCCCAGFHYFAFPKM
jgi:hypothetical protein